MSNLAASKPGRFEEEWVKLLDLAPMIMKGKADLQEAALTVMSVKKELAISGILLTRTALAPLGCEEVRIKHGENKDKSAGKLVVPSFPDETMNEEQGPSGSGRNRERDEKEREDRQPEEAMEQNTDHAGKDVDKISRGGVSNLDFNFLDDYEVEAETLGGKPEPAEDETSTLKPPSAFMNPSRDLPESSSPNKFKTTELKLLLESPRRRRIEDASRVLSWNLARRRTRSS